MEEILELFEEYITFILDEKGNFLSINNFECLDRDDVIGRAFPQIFEGEERKKAAAIFYNAVKNGKAKGMLRIRCRNESQILYVKIVKQDNTFYGIAREIKKEKPSFITDFMGNVIEAWDEWKSLEGKNIYDLVEEKEKFAEVISYVIEKGEYGGRIIINDKEAIVRIKATELLEFFIEENIFQVFEKILQGKNVDEIVERIGDALEAMHLSYHISIMGREKGVEESVEGEKHSFPVSKGGTIVGSITIYGEIEEENKKMVEFIRLLATHALESLEDISNILNDFAIYKIDKEGTIIYCNAKFEELTGYKRGEIVGRNSAEFAEHREEFMEALKEGKVRNFISKWRGKNKEFIANECAWAMDGEILILLNDVTAEKEKERDAEFYNSILRHDIYNKNEIALGYIGLIEKTNMTKKQKDMIKKVKEALHEANMLIQNVRKAEEIRKAKKELHIFDIKKVVEGECSSFKEIAEKNEIKLICEIESIPVIADEFIREIFSNLIKNAIEHAECKTIKIYGEKEDTHYKVYIEDDGKGIEKEDMKKIFEEGWKKGGSGSGLGLYIVKKLMERYDGKIEVESEVGKGTKFILLFRMPQKKIMPDILRIRF